MGTLKTLGIRLEEAVTKRQGQVLPTENESWGYYGTMSGRATGSMGMTDVWREGFIAMLNAFPGVPSKAIREFLDDKEGRHFADAVLDNMGGGEKPIESAPLKKSLKMVLGSARDGGWIRKHMAKLAGVQTIDAQAGTAAALAGLVKGVDDAWDDVKSQEQKKNWKQRDDAMHKLQKVVDVLKDGIMDWFSSSGRPRSHAVWKEAGKQVRVTIPEADESDPKRELMEESREGARFSLQLTELLRHWEDIQHLRSRIYGSGTPMDAKSKKDRDALNDEHEEHVDAIEAGLKNAQKLFAAWKAG